MRVVQAKNPNETGIAVLTMLVWCRYDQAKSRVVKEFGGDDDLTPAQMARMLNTIAIDPLNTAGDLDNTLEMMAHSRWVARHSRGAVQTLGDVIDRICWVGTRQTHPTAVLLRGRDGSDDRWFLLVPKYSDVDLVDPTTGAVNGVTVDGMTYHHLGDPVVASVRATF